MASTGVYRILVDVQTVQPSQFTLYKNGVAVPNATFGAFDGSQITYGDTIITLAAGDVLSLVNDTSLTGVVLQINAGGVKPPLNASFDIERIG
ncbi:hypothetical protein KDK_09050 [Dictyobacter kobayashii]|uniref:BclA C-terminal domain-containing protein n=1 Tax=Dictyobacter kobayashii TaxID=2014872 RepID=A0A402ADD1_9CHLR|nr:hypothetical protein KDK_09050 [Dictyobacter kobayashii]